MSAGESLQWHHGHRTRLNPIPSVPDWHEGFRRGAAGVCADTEHSPYHWTRGLLQRVVHAGVSAKGINPIKRLKIFLQLKIVILGHNRLCTWTPGGYNKEVQRQQLPHWQLQNSCRGWNSALCWGNVSALITNFNIINFRKTLQMYLTSKHAVIWGLYN